MTETRAAASAYDLYTAAGPDCLGRSVLVKPGQATPDPWHDCPRLAVHTESLDADTGRRLRTAWQDRQRLVIELDGSLPDPNPTLPCNWWELNPGTTLSAEVWHHLLTANVVDARDPGRLRFAPRDRALEIEERELTRDLSNPTVEVETWPEGLDSDAPRENPSPGTLRDQTAVVLEARQQISDDPETPSADIDTDHGPAWCDGGPLEIFDDGELGDAALIPAANLAAGRLRAIKPHAPKAELAADQRQAVGHLKGGACIVAPAGSGKTRVLTERVRWQVRDLGVSASAVCLVAYNVRARAEMQERTADLDGLEVRTLNSLALAICNGTGPFARPSDHRRVEVLNEREVRDILHELVGERSPKRRRRAMTDPLAPWIEALSASRLGLRDPAVVEADFAPDVPAFGEVAPAYADALNERGAVDFDHQIIRAIEILLTDPAARAQARKVCSVLLVDEFQDLTPAHLLMIRLLAGPRADVFGVGDDDQTIYGYSGASPRWLIEYQRFFPGAARHLLHVNYRCPAAVVQAASNLLSHSVHRIPKDIVASPRRAPSVVHKPMLSQGRSEPPTEGDASDPTPTADPGELSADEIAVEVVEDGAAAVVERVQMLIGTGVEAREVAVLTRVNSTLLAPQIMLAEAGIECMTPVGPWFLERTGVAAALAWLRLAADPGARLRASDLATACRRPPRGISPRVAEWIAEQRNVGALRRLAGRISDERTSLRVAEFADDIERLADMFRSGANTLKLLEAIRDGTRLGASLDERLDASRRSVDRSAHGDDLRALLSVAPRCEDPSEFGDWLAGRLAASPQSGDNDSDGDQRSVSPRWGRGVRLATVHRVKGLEWPHVIVLSAIEGLMPHRLASDTEEERRIFHVAITRCSESVLVVADGPQAPFVGEMKWRLPNPQHQTPGTAGDDPTPAGRLELIQRAAQRAARTTAATSAANGRSSARSTNSRPIDADTEPAAAAAFEKLRDWRWERCREDQVPAYVVFSNATLNELARQRPTTDEALLAISGIGPAKLASYGEAVKEVISEFNAGLNATNDQR